MKAKVFIYAKKFVGEPKLSDIQLVEEELETIKDGEILAEALFFGINAGLRAYIDLFHIGSVMVGAQVARLFKCFILLQLEI
jgi:prostaglandin reductase 1